MPAAMRDALHGISGHLSSSTRMLPPHGFHFFHAGLIAGLLTVSSGSAIDASAAKAFAVALAANANATAAISLRLMSLWGLASLSHHPAKERPVPVSSASSSGSGSQ